METETQADTKTLPPILQNAPSPPQLVTQGAEAILFQTTFISKSLQCALKFRPKKPYRHPILDLRLTRHRILAEARTLVKCRKDGVLVPGVYALDAEAGWLALEWIEGLVIKEVIRKRHRDRNRHDSGESEEFLRFMRKIGATVGSLHKAGVIHGDLTTSNMMLRPNLSPSSTGAIDSGDISLDGDVVLIDFGLASQSSLQEDRAVDLYVLERAFGSTHPKAETFFDEVLGGYSGSYKDAKSVLKRLEDVRQRGRKKSMIG